MLDAAAVDERVRGDAARDRDRQADADAVTAQAKAANEEHAKSDEQHTGDLSGRARLREEDRADGEDEHRREAARDRIDEAEVGAAVCGGEEGQVRELERRRPGDVRERSRVHVPDGRRDRRVQHDREREDDGGRRLDVARAREDEVPERVQDRRSERQGERRRRH